MSAPDPTQDREQLGLECLAEGLFTLLREQGHFKRLEEHAAKAEMVLERARKVFQDQQPLDAALNEDDDWAPRSGP